MSFEASLGKVELMIKQASLMQDFSEPLTC